MSYSAHSIVADVSFGGLAEICFFFLFATFSAREIQQRFTSPKFNSSPLKNDGWIRGELLNFGGVLFFNHFASILVVYA